MADSELGELRRPPRPLEQRLERIARWRAQGLAGGASDSTFPTDYVDGSAVAGMSEDGATGGEVPDWYFETFAVTSGSASTVTLTYVPIEYSEVVRLNGVVLAPTVDYTISESVLTFVDLTSLRLGIGADTWTLDVKYAYTDTAEVPFEAPSFLTWTVNGDAYISGSTVELTPASANKSGSIVCPLVIPIGWSQIDVTIDMSWYNGDGWGVVLWDAATHGTTEIGPGGTNYTSVFDNTYPSTDKTQFASNDGTTSISYYTASPRFSNGTSNPHTYLISFVKSSTTTATAAVYRDGSLVRSSATYGADLWVPDTVYLGIWGFNGALSSSLRTVSAVDVEVSN